MTNLIGPGASIAERYLIDAGLVVLDRSWKSNLGTIALVAKDGDETVFIEVETRDGAGGHPFEAITAVKLAQLRRLAATWCAEHPGTSRIRIDAIAVVAPESGAVIVEHLERVF